MCSRDHVAVTKWLVTVFNPVGLDEHAVELFEVHDAGPVADGFDECTETEIVGCSAASLRRNER